MYNNVFKRSNGVDKLNEKIATGESAFPEADNVSSVAIAPELSGDMDVFKVFNELVNLKKEIAMESEMARKSLKFKELESQFEYNRAISKSSQEFKDLGITNKEGREAYAELAIVPLKKDCLELEDTLRDLSIDLEEVDLKIRFLLAMAGDDN